MSNLSNIPQEPGHIFLARLGKKRLRPGGKRATDWLLQQVSINSDSKVLEVACNMGTTSIDLAKRFSCKVIGVDLDDQALSCARENAKKAGVSDLIQFLHEDARKLPFEPESFDIIINEAMMTMYTEAQKIETLQGYLRLLKPGGYLLMHDLVIRDSTLSKDEVIEQLKTASGINPNPLFVDEWVNLISAQGFDVSYLTGPMSLLRPAGLIYDEGLFDALKIVKNGLKSENRQRFLHVLKLFSRRKKQLGFIATCCKKPE